MTTATRVAVARLLAGCFGAASISAAVAACGDSSAPIGDAPTDAGTSLPPTNEDASQPADGVGVPSSDAGREAGPSTPPVDLTEVTPGKWAWFEFPETVCRDGSKAGFGLNVSPSGSKKIMFALEGGGACFNALTCLANFPKVEHKEPGGGMFDRAKVENPFAEYTQVHIPYCTGDVHAGNRRDVDVAGAKQQFVGYANVGFFLEKIAATFPDADRLVMIGPSAGGFGAAANYQQALRTFPSIQVNLVDDSGPLLADPLPDCLQEHWKKLWGFENTVLADCGADCVGQADFLRAAAKHAIASTPHAAGLLSATGDSTIRLMLGFGANKCTTPVPLSPSEEKYAAGLEDLKTFLAPHQNFGAFLYGGTNHTVLADGRFYTTTAGGKTAAEWVKTLVDTNTVTNVGP